MKGPILLDTGPLVAFLNRRDRFHQWAKGLFDSIVPPMLTCEAVLSEACFLLRQARGAQAVLELVRRDVIAVSFRLQGEVAAVERLLSRYGNVLMSLADACLVRMAEQYGTATLLTLDRDFRVYRKHGRQTIQLNMPADL